MALTSLVLKNKEFREIFRQSFKKPESMIGADYFIQPNHDKGRSGVIGIAFQYCLEMKIMIENKNSQIINGKPAFYRGISYLEEELMIRKERGLGYNEFYNWYELILSVANSCKDMFELVYEGISHGIITDIDESIIEHVISGAYFDILARRPEAVSFPPDYSPRSEEIVEIKNMLSIVPEYLVKGEEGEKFVFGKTFGESSELVGGADSDIIKGRCLIEVKTSRVKSVTLDFWRQVLGYCLLNENEILNKSGVGLEIDSCGIYMARHGKFYGDYISNMIDQNTLEELRASLLKNI